MKINSNLKIFINLKIITKAGCSYLTQLGVGRSVLNDHAYSIGLSPSPECQCHAPRESPEHIILKCFLYNQECLTLMSKVETLLPKFGNFIENQKLEMLLFLICPDDPYLYQIKNKYKLQFINF